MSELPHIILSDASFFQPFQYAYRSRHSTAMAVLKVFSYIVDALDVGKIALLALLDFTAAFDTVDILLQRLWRSFCINATGLSCFESYVTGRTEAVHLSGTTTSPHPLVCVDPQGSVLGPLLFVLYMTYIGFIEAAHGLLHHCYADDTQMYFYCPSECAALKGKVLSCIDAVIDWTMTYKLHLNSSNTEFLWCAALPWRHHINKESF